MKAGTTPIAGSDAPALQVQEEIRRLTLAVSPHLAEGNALLCRCQDLKSRRPGDAGLLWAAARLITADAALGKHVAKVFTPPRRKAKSNRRQSVDAELNSHSLNFNTGDGPKDSK